MEHVYLHIITKKLCCYNPAGGIPCGINLKMNITVYCGSNNGNDPEFIKRAGELGKWMAGHGHRLVYGGGVYGMMGAVSGAVSENGGEVTGIAPAFFIDNEEVRDDLTELIVSEGMSDRRNMMMDLGDAFIALPGGTGTLDEITEVLALKRLGLLGKADKPVMLYNINGYYDSFFAFLGDMAREGFCRAEDRAYAIEVRCLEDIEQALKRAGSEDKSRNTLYDK